MTKQKNDRYYAEMVLRDIEKLLHFAARADFSDPEKNEEAIYAMNFCMVQIKENIACLSEDFQKYRLGLRIGQLDDFRNTLVHEYGHTDYSAYKELVNNDMRRIKGILEEYLGG